MTTHSVESEFTISDEIGAVSSILLRPDNPTSFLVMGHGAGAGMRHPFMEVMAGLLAERGIATFRYQFPYMEQGKGRPDARPVLIATVRAAVEQAVGLKGNLPLLAGGKSMGGRMTSMAAAEAPLPRVKGLIFFGFPLHAAGRHSVERSYHLSDVHLPMLFLQGTRDQLADPELLTPVVEELGERAVLHIVEGADHSYHVLKRSGRTDEEVQAELAAATDQWITERILPSDRQ